MPDAHGGYGLPIGGVAAVRLDDPDAAVCPGGVGFDVNCGVRLIRTDPTHQDVERKQRASRTCCMPRFRRMSGRSRRTR